MNEVDSEGRAWQIFLGILRVSIVVPVIIAASMTILLAIAGVVVIMCFLPQHLELLGDKKKAIKEWKEVLKDYFPFLKIMILSIFHWKPYNG